MEQYYIESELIESIKAVVNKPIDLLKHDFDILVQQRKNVNWERSIGKAFFYNYIFQVVANNKDKICNINCKATFQYYFDFLKEELEYYSIGLLCNLLALSYKLRKQDWTKNNTLWLKDEFIKEEIERIQQTLNYKSVINETSWFIKTAFVSFNNLIFRSISEKQIINIFTSLKDLKKIISDTDVQNAVENVYIHERQKEFFNEIENILPENIDEIINIFTENGSEYVLNLINKELEFSTEKVFASEDNIKGVIKLLHNGRSEYIAQDDLYSIFIKALKKYQIYLENEFKPEGITKTTNESEKTKINQSKTINEIGKKNKIDSRIGDKRKCFISIIDDLIIKKLMLLEQRNEFIKLYDDRKVFPQIDWHKQSDWLLYLLMKTLVITKFIKLVENEVLVDFICNNFTYKGKQIDKNTMKTTYKYAKKRELNKENTIFGRKKLILRRIFNKYGFNIRILKAKKIIMESKTKK